MRPVLGKLKSSTSEKKKRMIPCISFSVLISLYIYENCQAAGRLLKTVIFKNLGI